MTRILVAQLKTEKDIPLWPAGLTAYLRKMGIITDLTGEIINKKKADFICFYIFPWNEKKSLSVISKAKKNKPSVKIIVLGSQLSYLDYSLLENDDIDFAVIGSGEREVLSIVNGNYEDMPGVFYKNKGKIVCPKLKNFKWLNYNEIPSPYLENILNINPVLMYRNLNDAFSFKKIPKQVRDDKLRHPITDPFGRPELVSGSISGSKFRNGAIETYRGCPNKCAYCYFGFYPQEPSYADYEKIRGELQLFKKNKVLSVDILDPIFNHDNNHFENVCSIIRETGFSDTIFTAFIRAEILTESQVCIMKELNFRNIQIPLISTNKLVLKKALCGISLDLWRKNIKMLLKNNLSFAIELILGLPHETEESFKKTVDFLVKEGLINYSQVFIFYNHPSCRFYKEKASFFMPNIDIAECVNYGKNKGLRFVGSAGTL